MNNGIAAAQMPVYQSHKKVWALKILSIAIATAGGATITPADAGYGPFEVDQPYLDKHKPEAGGYYVVYADGYKSFSPAAAFEAGNTRIGAAVAGGNMSEQQVEKEISDKGLNAPRVTPAMVDAAILAEQYHVFVGTQLTVCCLTLQNGFTVTGESACASPENFNEELGRKIARDNARQKIWALEGYALRERLAAGKTNIGSGG